VQSPTEFIPPGTKIPRDKTFGDQKLQIQMSIKQKNK